MVKRRFFTGKGGVFLINCKEELGRAKEKGQGRKKWVIDKKRMGG